MKAARASADGGLDYLVCGTVFPTRSKAAVLPIGRTALAEVVRSTTLPVLAIGGVTAATAGEVRRAGAAGLAAIGLFVESTVDRLPSVVSELFVAFDTPEGVP